ncbi:serine/threonine protein kinase [bacterium]|jgi:eukaryotic-like serine/threonine-protein kinase|nr:serine/threonine protein kinase [Planctomicrobium sp.]MDB4793302.1 serine/threonine protein kinase [bacterium]
MSDDRDDHIFSVLNELIERAQAGQPILLNETLEQYPEIADEVQQLWATIVVAENLSLGGTHISSKNYSETDYAVPPEAPQLPDYEIFEEIGRGGMGIVYRARQISLNRIVAIKMLLSGSYATPVNQLRFQSEAKSAGGLDHPHIVSVFEIGESARFPFFSMPYIDGTTLARRISERTLGNREAATLMVPVCRALGYAHRNGILHRDLKPSNILIDHLNHPFVSDFGLAKRVRKDGDGDHSLTESGAIIGTPGYMAPEQAAGERNEMSSLTDVYSLGAILYACMTGRAPFQAATAVDTLLTILEQEPPPPRLLNSKIDSDLEVIILKAMQKPSDLRYNTADALADDLEAYLNHEPIAARSSHFSQVISRVFRPTHHIGVLENWGLLWMWHAVVLLFLCITTDVIKNRGVVSPLPYFGLWTFGLGAWAIIFWNLRRRSGPVTFVERQIAHTWAASMACSTGLFVVEMLLGLPVLTLSPVLALIASAVFVVKAGILSGEFYIHALVLFLTAVPMALFPTYSLTLFGLASAATFFIPGLKFHLIKRAQNLET